MIDSVGLELILGGRSRVHSPADEAPDPFRRDGRAVGRRWLFCAPKKTPTGGGGEDPAPTTTPTPTAPAAPADPTLSAKLAPLQEKALLFREAAGQLFKAGAALDSGNKNLAEQLFSTAELLTGPEAVASLAPLFREGARRA